MGDSLEILIVLGIVVAGAFWVKNQYPESAVAKGINCVLAKGFAKVQKPELQAESVNPVATPPVDTEVHVSAVNQGNVSVAVTPLSEVPEDSVLRRHYFAALAAEREAITHPYPTDSVLRRHYESRFGLLTTPSAASVEPAHLSTAEATESVKLSAPEDLALNRHFLTQLRAEVEAKFLPRPTDFTLSRHYESLIQAEVAARLQAAV